MLKKLITMLIFVVSAVIFLGLTDPNSIPVGLLIVPCLMVFLIIVFGVEYLQEVIGLTQKKKMRAISVLSASVGTIILFFYASGGFGFSDLVLASLIVIIGLFYINRF